MVLAEEEDLATLADRVRRFEKLAELPPAPVPEDPEAAKAALVARMRELEPKVRELLGNDVAPPPDRDEEEGEDGDDDEDEDAAPLSLQEQLEAGDAWGE